MYCCWPCKVVTLERAISGTIESPASCGPVGDGKRVVAQTERIHASRGGVVTWSYHDPQSPAPHGACTMTTTATSTAADTILAIDLGKYKFACAPLADPLTPRGPTAPAQALRRRAPLTAVRVRGAPGPDHLPVGPSLILQPPRGGHDWRRSRAAPLACPLSRRLRRFTWVDRATPSWAPTALVLAVAVSAHAVTTIPQGMRIRCLGSFAPRRYQRRTSR
jgi:hypothetical protein